MGIAKKGKRAGIRNRFFENPDNAAQIKNGSSGSDRASLEERKGAKRINTARKKNKGALNKEGEGEPGPTGE